MLRDILKANPDQTYRLLQCLTVATRPLGVDELAEILALNFDGAKDGIPALNKDWRWDDEQQGVLAMCSSLIVVVDSFDYDLGNWTRVVQFAHFSVKEFLTSERLADIKADVSRFHIHLEPAHTVVAQACLAILLHLDHDDSVESISPLSGYAARHWVDHANFGNVSLHIEFGMRRLFDPAEPYFTAWLNAYDLDHEWTSFVRDGSDSRRSSWSSKPGFTSLGEDDAPLCLYYAALCGVRDVIEYLITKYPQHLNATVGLTKSPLAAALYSKHLQVAEILRQNGAVRPIGDNGRTLLHAASKDGLVDVSQWLLIGADANAQDAYHRTSLHEASENGHVGIVRLLIEHGADVHARDQSQLTPLHLASSKKDAETVRLLIKLGADVNIRDRRQQTLLHLASSFRRNAEQVQLLINHGADVNARDQSQSTPLHLASSKGDAETVQLLIKHGADVRARDQSQSTPLHLAPSNWDAETAQLLIEHGADVDARDQSQSTPLHLASSTWSTKTVYLLIEHGADVHARDQSQQTPLHLALFKVDAETVQLLIEHGADVNSRDRSQQTLLHLASSKGDAETVRLLIKHGADVHARDQSQSTPLHLASSRFPWTGETAVRLLIEHGASVNAYDKNHQTPLHWVSSCDEPNANVSSLRLLLKNGADVDVWDDKGLTAFQIASAKGHRRIAQLLLDHSARIASNTID
jgi:ankyrin repeat protein